MENVSGNVPYACLFLAVFLGLIGTVHGLYCKRDCHPPKCSCPQYNYPMNREDIPQMVYFGFDDAVNVMVSALYDRIFTENRTNPNGCPAKMTLFVSHKYTDYRRVKNFHENGHEIGVHSVTHSVIGNENLLRQEAKKQKDILMSRAGIPEKDIVGWRSPFLKPASVNQPKILKELGYEYDITYTYTRTHMSSPKPWPFTLDSGWPFRCATRPCARTRVKGFWTVPVEGLMDFKDLYPCTYVDGCVIGASNEKEAYKYLMDNFMSYYNTTRSPFGLNMHAAWFYRSFNLDAMLRFLDDIGKMDNVYIVTVKQMLDWMKYPTPLANISSLKSWNCHYKEPTEVPTTTTTTEKVINVTKLDERRNNPMWFILRRLF
ncbi:chitin deacetylase 8-like [Mya arenaria]|uniref:chitin deacetylase 8-like n=1 Tax=Mya arenaria TaxID=6604 RepID=UPI0022E72E49|nr:chitin deacetylase 8-like [Mya arenaria]